MNDTKAISLPPEAFRTTNGGMLNIQLARRQDLGADNVKRLVELHHEKDTVMREAHERIKQLEREMQLMWNFDVDDNKFTHCHQIPNPPQRFELEELLKQFEG